MQQFHNQTPVTNIGERTYSRTGSAFRKSGLADFVGVDGRSPQRNSYGNSRYDDERCCRKGKRGRDCRDCRKRGRRGPGVVGMLARFVFTLVEEAISDPPNSHPAASQNRPNLYNSNGQNRSSVYRGQIELNNQSFYDGHSVQSVYNSDRRLSADVGHSGQSVYYGQAGQDHNINNFTSAAEDASPDLQIHQEYLPPPAYGAVTAVQTCNRKN